jgi:putative transposase
MIKRKEGKLEYAFKQKEKGAKNKECAFLCNIGIRWFQKLYAEYKMTRKIPQINKSRRPKIELTNEQKQIIENALKESGLRNSVAIRLYIIKYNKQTIPNNKIHKYLLEKGISKEEKKKKRQRKYCKYQRDHSFSLVHLDWHDSRFAEGKFVCTVEDDASRLILCGGEFNNEEAIHAIKLMKKAIKIAYEKYSSVIKECNTDKGTQFYNSTLDKNGNRSLGEFEIFLKEQKINHIPSRRNHPQTNGKKERWFRTYEENRHRFKTFREFINWYNKRIHLGLNKKEGITPNEAVINKLQPESILGLLFRIIESK